MGKNKRREHLTAKNKLRKRIFAIMIVIVFLGISGLVFWKVGKPLMQFVSDTEGLRVWVDSHWLWSRLAYVGIIILQIVIAIIPGEPFEIAAGYAFGAVEGTTICMLGSTVGGTLVFLLVRRFGVKLVEVFISVDKINSLKFLKNDTRRDILIFLLFFIPGTPKDVLCYFAGLTRMRLRTWVLITSVAKFPSIVTSTVCGNAIGEEEYFFAVIVFVATFLVSAAGLLFYNYYTKKRQTEESVRDKDTPD